MRSTEVGTVVVCIAKDGGQGGGRMEGLGVAAFKMKGKVHGARLMLR